MPGPWFIPYGHPRDCRNAYQMISQCANLYFEEQLEAVFRGSFPFPTAAVFVTSTANANQSDNDMSFACSGPYLTVGCCDLWRVDSLALGGLNGFTLPELPPPFGDVTGGSLGYALLVDDTDAFPGRVVPVLGGDQVLAYTTLGERRVKALCAGSSDPADGLSAVWPSQYIVPSIWLLTLTPPWQRRRCNPEPRTIALGALALDTTTAYLDPRKIYDALWTRYGADLYEQGDCTGAEDHVARPYVSPSDWPDGDS